MGQVAKPTVKAKAKVRVSKKDHPDYDPHHKRIIPKDWKKKMAAGTFEPYPGYVRKKKRPGNIQRKGSIAYPGGEG